MTVEKRQAHTAEFKREAVRLVTEEGYKVAEAARNLGINANMLGRWRRESQEADAFPGKGRMKPMEEELRRLQRENRQLKMDREILKKAAAFFAREGK
ncbi:MAG: transposase [Dehalococcoidia bacterium]